MVSAATGAHQRSVRVCDIACCLAVENGRRVLVTIEVKYTDTFSTKPVIWAPYEQHLTALGLNQDETTAVVKAGCSQVLRWHEQESES